MKLPTPHKYALKLKANQSYTVQLEDSVRYQFHAPETKVCPKIYVVMRGSEIHYVGITNRPMSARLNYGLKATGKRGYHGYQWKKLKGELAMLVWSFPKKSGKKFMRQLETIEAEFAFLVRKETANWPLSQTEIHFYSPRKEHLDAAQSIMKTCLT